MSRAAITFAGAMAILGVGLAVSAATPDPSSGLKPVAESNPEEVTGLITGAIDVA